MEALETSILARIDQQELIISQSQLLISQLKSELNSLQPIFRLHDDLLLEIFSVYMASYKSDLQVIAVEGPGGWLMFKPALGSSSNPNEWIIVTHICRHWRIAALNSPTLWTHISTPVQHADFVREQLVRSRTAPLIVEALWDEVAPSQMELHRWLPGLAASRKYSQEKSIDSLKFVLTELPRVQKLAITLTPEVYHCLLERTSASAAPLLESLVVSFAWPMSQASSPALFSGTSLPRLERLQIMGVSRSLGFAKSLFQQSVKHLYLSGNSSQFPLPSEILFVFRSMPALQTLQVSGLLETPDHITGLSQMITLDKLSSISLEGTASGCVSLLTHLHIPPDTRVQMYWNTIHGETLLLRLIDKWVSTPNFAKSLLSFSMWIQPHLELTGWSDLRPVGELKTLSPASQDIAPLHRLKITIPLHAVLEPTLLVDICRPLSLHNVQALTLGYGTSKFNHKSHLLPYVTTVASGMVNVRKLGICNWGVPDLATFLSDQPPPFPLLTDLVCEGLIFGPHIGSISRIARREPTVNLLRKALESRRLGDRHAEIGKVELICCIGFAQRDFDCLVGAVEDLQWDHVYGALNTDMSAMIHVPPWMRGL